jgi:hypothetical protein
MTYDDLAPEIVLLLSGSKDFWSMAPMPKYEIRAFQLLKARGPSIARKPP